jgi:hypothetical protein
MSGLESDDFTTPANLTLLRNFNIFSLNDTLTNLDDSFSSYKGLSNITNNSLSAVLYASTNFCTPVSYLSLFNHFRADFEDLSFVSNGSSGDKQLFVDNKRSVSDVMTTRLSNQIVTRSGVKNSIVTFNALRKVFRARFDEGRSHTSFQFFAQNYLPQPFINDGVVSYNQLLSKDRTTFFQNISYVVNTPRVLSLESEFAANQNYYFYDLPFLLSEGSDPQKFM